MTTRILTCFPITYLFTWSIMKEAFGAMLFLGLAWCFVYFLAQWIARLH